MKNKKLILSILIFGGAVLLLLGMMSKNPLMTALKMVKKTATCVEIVNNNLLYNNFYKRFDASFAKRVLNLLEFEAIRKRSGKHFGAGGTGSNWQVRFCFYNNGTRIFRIILTQDGEMFINNEWNARLTSESRSRLKELLASVGLTDEIGLLPLAANVSAASNIVFRKESTIPYTIDDMVFIMPGEQFRVGLMEGVIEPSVYAVFYRDDQIYTDSLDIHFNIDPSASAQQQARLDIKNNSPDLIRFELSFMTPKEFIYGQEPYVVGPNETFSIEADPSASCYVAGCFRRLRK